ncbi:MAG: leucine--tRNA ligase [Candidatus Peregrinibacteria bacterium]|nr:leucine--tRNA ligase [Candidatus Peregrinibacteria bacterium]
MYDAQQVEKKWQKRWSEKGLYTTSLHDQKRPKYYNLVMFPYPSGDKLHVGHWYNYAPADSWGRYMRMKGFNVFEPIGFDSFGLPAENYAIKTGIHPTVSIAQNCAKMEEQLSLIGTMYDWSKKIVTSDPEYYQWTQWVFLQLYKKGLAYRKRAPVNWCPSCQTVLANEQVNDGKCDRCKSEVTKKELTQWFFNIRSYAERLLNFEGLDWPEKTKLMQQHWIGRSEGSTVQFEIFGRSGKKIEVYTTRVDTLFGCTYVVLAPEHPLVGEITEKLFEKDVAEYIESAKRETDINRSAEGRDKTGVETGAYAVNPVNGKRVPIWIADYVLMTYGTGAVMAVPAHDERDFAFAKKYDLPMITVVKPPRDNSVEPPSDDRSIAKGEAFTGDGVLVSSGDYTGLSSELARKKITELLHIDGLADFKVNYKLRDWLVSRQRYWGAPIPMIYCQTCGEVPLSEEQLPVLLPEDVEFRPKGGKSPLAFVDEFMAVKCPTCGGDAQRESDTMDTFVDSSWYFLRYPAARMKDGPFSTELANKWLPVDMYIGGPEHACMHLLYARFINMVMHDLGYIDFEEPFKRLVHQGLVTKDGAKMSKSKGNVVSPDAFVSQYGSDVFRMYLMFMGPFEAGGDWSDLGITGVARFVERFWNLMADREVNPGFNEASSKRNVHKTIKKVTEGIEAFTFNTAIAGLMEFVNEAMKVGVTMEDKKMVTRLIAPLAPHMAEEIWEYLGEKESIFNASYPSFDPAMLIEDSVEIAIQVNGKVRGTVVLATGCTKDEALRLAREQESIKKYLEAPGVSIKKEIYVPNKLVSFVL